MKNKICNYFLKLFIMKCILISERYKFQNHMEESFDHMTDNSTNSAWAFQHPKSLTIWLFRLTTRKYQSSTLLALFEKKLLLIDGYNSHALKTKDHFRWHFLNQWWPSPCSLNELMKVDDKSFPFPCFFPPFLDSSEWWSCYEFVRVCKIKHALFFTDNYCFFLTTISYFVWIKIPNIVTAALYLFLTWFISNTSNIFCDIKWHWSEHHETFIWRQGRLLTALSTQEQH